MPRLQSVLCHSADLSKHCSRRVRRPPLPTQQRDCTTRAPEHATMVPYCRSPCFSWPPRFFQRQVDRKNRPRPQPNRMSYRSLMPSSPLPRRQARPHNRRQPRWAFPKWWCRHRGRNPRGPRRPPPQLRPGGPRRLPPQLPPGALSRPYPARRERGPLSLPPAASRPHQPHRKGPLRPTGDPARCRSRRDKLSPR